MIKFNILKRLTEKSLATSFNQVQLFLVNNSIDFELLTNALDLNFVRREHMLCLLLLVKLWLLSFHLTLNNSWELGTTKVVGDARPLLFLWCSNKVLVL